MNKDLEKEKFLAAKEAVKYIEPLQIVGLGTGSTAFYVIREIGEMIAKGLKIKAVATSKKTEELAASFNIPLLNLDEVDTIDITIDGADEFDAELNLIKGGGGALLREKMVARLSRQEIIIADSSKKVKILGAFKVPIEVTPFTINFVMKRILEVGGVGKIRERNAKTFITDTNNLIIDADFGKITNPAELSDKIDRIEGVVCHGLFVNLVSQVIMGDGDKTFLFMK
jgi:ribose 5-phosphate isomerase A